MFILALIFILILLRLFDNSKNINNNKEEVSVKELQPFIEETEIGDHWHTMDQNRNPIIKHSHVLKKLYQHYNGSPLNFIQLLHKNEYKIGGKGDHLYTVSTKYWADDNSTTSSNVGDILYSKNTMFFVTRDGNTSKNMITFKKTTIFKDFSESGISVTIVGNVNLVKDPDIRKYIWFNEEINHIFYIKRDVDKNGLSWDEKTKLALKPYNKIKDLDSNTIRKMNPPDSFKVFKLEPYKVHLNERGTNYDEMFAIDLDLNKKTGKWKEEIVLA